MFLILHRERLISHAYIRYMASSPDLLPLIFCATRLEEARLDEMPLCLL